MKKVLVIGGSGLVGSRFIELYNSKYEFFAPDHGELDITSQDSIKQNLSKFNPDVVVNFAAYTDVSKAEEERDDRLGLVWKLNVVGVENLVKSLTRTTFFIQISTDMVFSGSEVDPGPYAEDHEVELDSNKVTWYGYTKGQGELIVRQRPNSAILRIIYPVRAKYDLKLDYLRKPLSLFDQGKLYPLFDDQQISFAFIDEISLALTKIIDKNLTGTYHASSSDTTTPFEVVSYLIKAARKKINVVKSASLVEFLKSVSNPVRYPKYGGLRIPETEKRLGVKFSSWRKIIDIVVEQGIGK